MSNQINLKLSDRMFNSAKKFSEKKGFNSMQDFIREILREKLFERGYDNSFNEREIALIDEIIEKSLKRGNLVSEKEFLKALK
jgi:Arc/MetJ-type ribon-helix-helix transcriptional regulator